MRQFLPVVLILLISFSATAQNLVPNGDFEQYNSCPTSFSQIDSTVGWTVPTTYVSTDYFNTCSQLSSLVSVPVNQGTGYQWPHSGNGYAGIFLQFSMLPDTREYLETELTAPLTAGQCYHFEMYVNILNGTGFTSDDIAVYFSDTALTNIPGFGVLPYTAQVNNATGNVFDTLNWVLVQGNFTAAGGEKFMTIGNFKTDANTTLIQFYPGGVDGVYTYIDDVSLTVCTGVEDVLLPFDALVYTDQQHQELVVEPGSAESVELRLYDISSRELLTRKFSGVNRMDISGFSKGIYLYNLSAKNGSVKSGKVLIQ